MSDRRYPVGPLVDAIALDFNPVNHWEAGHIIGYVSRRLNVDRSVLYRAKHHGLTEETADRLACRAGFHPCEVWDDWWDAVEKGAAARGNY